MKDWMMEAALNIYHGGEHGEHLDTSPEIMRDVIAEHSPFKDGVAYMPVPRCETCAHWTTSTQECAALRTGPLNVIYTSLDFGCVKWNAR